MSRIKKCPLCGHKFLDSTGVAGCLQNEVVLFCDDTCKELAPKLEAEEAKIALETTTFAKARLLLARRVSLFPTLGGVDYRHKSLWSKKFRRAA